MEGSAARPVSFYEVEVAVRVAARPIEPPPPGATAKSTCQTIVGRLDDAMPSRTDNNQSEAPKRVAS